MSARREKTFGMLDSTAGMISMRRHSKGQLEGAAKIIWAQPGKLRESGERYRFAQMRVDMRRYYPLLPSRKSASKLGFGSRRPFVKTDQFMSQDDTQRFQVPPILQVWAFERPHQFEGGAQKRCVLKEELRRECHICRVRVERNLQLGRIKIDEHETRKRPRLHAIQGIRGRRARR